jgi:hypothetical protein
MMPEGKLREKRAWRGREQELLETESAYADAAAAAADNDVYRRRKRHWSRLE